MFFQRNIYNKYDYAIMLCISLLAFGGIGGALQPIRIIALFFSPFVFVNLRKFSKSKEIAISLIFFIFWYVYAIITLFITSDIAEGLKQLLYYFSHFSLFFLLILLSEKAKLPLRSIIYGWVFFFLLTSPIALNEIINDRHLSLSFSEQGDLYQNFGQGTIVQKRFASVTFTIYNEYSLILCYTLPFLFGFILIANDAKRQIIGFLLLFLVSFFLLTNASRGGILCLLSSIIVFLFSYKNAAPKYKRILFLFIIISVFVIYYYSDILFSQMAYRFIAGRKLYEDDARFSLYQTMWNLLTESWFMGTGIGSMVESFRQANAGEILAVHNLFLEVLMQFGIIVFFMFCCFLFMIFKNGYKSKDRVIRFIIYISFFCFMLSSVINSGYMLIPSVWVFIASIFIISFNKAKNKY